MYNEQQEMKMKEAFVEQARTIVYDPDRFRKNGHSVKIGFESEVAIYSENTVCADLETKRNAILQDVAGFTDVELGAAQIELRTPPIDILGESGFDKLRDIYKKNFLALAQAARKQDTAILRVGSNPFLPIKNTPRTNEPKYRLVPDFYNQHRPQETDTIIGLGKHRVDIGDAAIVSLFQSFQINLEAQSFEDACDKMNRSFAIAPYLMAMAANARYLEFLDTEIQDMRLLAWEMSHDTRMCDVRLLSWEKAFDLRNEKEVRAGHALRVGLPERYFMGMDDYLARAGSFPFILYQPDAALGIAIGMTWLDARIKFIGDSLVVELRLLPTQPTIDEELLLTLLYVGRLACAQKEDEQLLPMEYVRENRLSAMLYGMRRPMWFLSDNGSLKYMPYKTGIKLELQKAERGLNSLGLNRFLNKPLIESILASGSPSDRLVRSLRNNRRGKLRDRMKNALQETRMLV